MLIAASENGWAGQVCRPCPKAVTSRGLPSPAVSVNRCRSHRVHGRAEPVQHAFQGGPLLGVPALGDGAHRVGVDEGGGAVEQVEVGGEGVEGGADGGAGPTPGGEPHAVPEPAGEGEEVDGPGVAQGGDLGVEGEVEGGEVGRDVVLAEERARQGAPTVEDLVGELAPQHEVVGDALAGDLLG